jgi:hypothetical protein
MYSIRLDRAEVVSLARRFRHLCRMSLKKQILSVINLNGLGFRGCGM